MGEVALLEQPWRLVPMDSCTAEAPEGRNALGAYSSTQEELAATAQTCYHMLSCRAGCHNDNARRALTIAQGRLSAHPCSAAQASIRMKGLRAQHF